MPSVPTLISGGISLGIIASFISGVYYVLIAGLKWVGKLQASLQIAEEKRADKWSCARCGRDLSRVKTGPSRRVQCARCSLLVCRNCCSKTSAASWICSNCRKYRDITLQTGEWFYEQLKKRFYSTVATIPRNANQDVEVRDFMEQIVEEMVGGELDNVSLRPLSSHPEYVKFCEIHHDELALTLAKFSLALQMAVTDKVLPDSDSPSAVHEELKELIKRIIKEAMTLPSLKNYSNGSVSHKEPLNGEVDELEKKSYEDILATAVINKIVERYQNELYNYEISNSKSSLRDSNGNVVRRRKLRRHRLTAGIVEGSNSSDSEGSAACTNDDCSWSGSSRTDPLSLTIEECIEEVVTKYGSDEDPEEPDSELKHFLSGLNFRRRQRAPFPEFGMDVVDKRHSSSSSEEDDCNEEDEDEIAHRVGVEVVSPVESWEENWLFQRRRLKTACLSQSMPVPMLVPNPSQDEPRARIGDVDIDETSDLSDCSDIALEDIIDGSDVDVRGVTKLNLSINHKISSDENSDSEDEFFLKNYNRNVIKSIDSMKPKVNGVCNGNIDNDLIVNRVNINVIHHDEDMDTEFSSNALDSTSPSQTSPSDSKIIEAKNNELIPQVDSGEGSLEMQQDRDYTVEYDAPVQVPVKHRNEKPELMHDTKANADSSAENNTAPITKDNENESSPLEKPVPKPRTNQTAQKEEKTNNSNNEEDEADGKENFDSLLMTPPRPGTIAEREHLKWQKAVPLTNNPYSKENIERRQRERLLLSRQSSSDISVEFPELTGANDSSVIHIDCSGRKPDYKQYGRDYYINNGGVKKDNERNEKERERLMETEKPRKDSSEKSGVSTPLNKPEDKPQVSVRVEVEVGRWPNSSSATSNGTTTVSSVETKTRITDIKDDEQHLTTISTSTASANNDNLNDKHHQVTTVSTWSSKDKSNKDNKNYITLPSVKELAKQFSSTENNEQVASVPTAVQKRLEVQTSPIKQVHSLTARCISKEFREGLRAANQPKTYQVKPVEKFENNSGNISDDSGTASPTPSSGCNPKLYNSIAFWEQMKSSRQ